MANIYTLKCSSPCNNSPASTLSLAVCLSYSMSDSGSLVTRVLLLPLGVSTPISNSVLAFGCFMHGVMQALPLLQVDL